MNFCLKKYTCGCLVLCSLLVVSFFAESATSANDINLDKVVDSVGAAKDTALTSVVLDQGTDYELDLGDYFELTTEESDSTVVEDVQDNPGAGNDQGFSSVTGEYVDIYLDEPSAGDNTYSGTYTCPSGYALSGIKIQRTVWKTLDNGISYMEFYCAPLNTEGEFDMINDDPDDIKDEVKDFAIGYDTGEGMERVDCGYMPIAGIMMERSGGGTFGWNADELGVVCSDASINASTKELVAGLYSNINGTLGYDLNDDFYSYIFTDDDSDAFDVSEYKTDSFTWADYTDASWCVYGLETSSSYNTFAGAGVVTGIEYKYRKENDDTWTTNKNAFIFSLKVNCRTFEVVEIPAECGDGEKEGVEECDDGNSSNRDSCTNNCKNSECGDGYVETGVEECDDGNDVNTDSCTNECLDAECGDGIVLDGDKGWKYDTDILDDVKMTDDKFDAYGAIASLDSIILTKQTYEIKSGSLARTAKVNPSISDAVIDDAVIDANSRTDDFVVIYGSEECDDGNNSNRDDCTNNCKNAECGDGYVQTGVEECDDDNLTSGDGCNSECIKEECGNGTLDVGEGCDDGNSTDGDGCSANCTEESASPECGDGNLDSGEGCDDGNTTGGDGCAADCTIETVPAECGDGNLDSGEECDDGNSTSGDGCAYNCTVEKPICGNGLLESDEGCDDGNTADGDGCNSECTSEACGNGTLDSGEQCDDGNVTPGDGCDHVCEIEGKAVACTIGNLMSTPYEDFDNDGIVNMDDNCPCSYNPAQTDTDEDGVGDTNQELNENGCDNCPGLANGSADELIDVNEDGYKNPLDSDVRQIDSDNDGYGDACDQVVDPCGDTDADGDGVNDLCDNCSSTYNPDQQQSDSDSFGDECDNCDVIENADQSDTDADGVGDVCEASEQEVTPLDPEPTVGASYGAFGGACGCNFVATSGSSSLPMLVASVFGTLMLVLRRRSKS